MKFRTAAIAAVALSIALVLTGCMNAPGSDSESGEFNAADEWFVTGMIPHHEQALEMAEVVLAKDGVDERVVGLADRIQDAQQPEIDLMNSWLDAWGVDPGTGGTGGMGHGGHGMMSDYDLAALEAASGAEASSLFLEQMVRHHMGAIHMAQQELGNGQNEDVLGLARKIIDDQSAEIVEMQELLTQL